MPLLQQEELDQFENMIYLPMLLTIFEQDQKAIDNTAFKLKGPYLKLVEEASKLVQKDFIATKMYMKEKGYRLIKGETDEVSTMYHYFYDGYKDNRKYLNLRLRNRSEELIREYLGQAVERINPQP